MSDKSKPHVRVERDENDRVKGWGVTSSGRVQRGATGHPEGHQSSGDDDRNAGEDVTRKRP